MGACMCVEMRVPPCARVFRHWREVVATAESHDTSRACAGWLPSASVSAGGRVCMCTCVSTSAGVSPRVRPVRLCLCVASVWPLPVWQCWQCWQCWQALPVPCVLCPVPVRLSACLSVCLSKRSGVCSGVLRPAGHSVRLERHTGTLEVLCVSGSACQCLPVSGSVWQCVPVHVTGHTASTRRGLWPVSGRGRGLARDARPLPVFYGVRVLLGSVPCRPLTCRHVVTCHAL